MNFGKRLALTAVGAVLGLSLISLLISSALVHITGNAAQLKALLRSSGIYTSAIPTILANAGNKDKQSQEVNPQGVQTPQTSTELPLSDPGLQQVITTSFPPSFVQSQVEGAVDGIFNWLSGTTTTPNFTIDLESRRAVLATEASAYALKRVATLPACPSDQIPTDINPFTITCLPPGYTPEQAASEVSTQITTQTDFLKDGSITGQTAKVQDDQTISQAFADAPAQYQRLRMMPLILGILSLVCSAAIIALCGVRAGFRRVGTHFVTIGTFITLAAWIATTVAHKVIETALKSADNSTSLQHSITTIANTVSNSLRSSFMTVGISLAVGGVIIIVLSRFMPKRTS